MTTVVLNKGGQFGLPHKFFGDNPEKGSGIFIDFVTLTAGDFTLTGSPLLAGREHGTALLLDAADEIETTSASFCPSDANATFAASSRTKIVFGANDTTTQNILFGTDSSATPAERLGFRLATSGDGTDQDPVEAIVVSCEFDDGTADLGVTLAASELPEFFDPTAYHTYSVLCEPAAGGSGVKVSYYIDSKLVKEISQTDTSNWAAGGLVWTQTNLTASSTHDQAIDWISIGTDIGYV